LSKKGVVKGKEERGGGTQREPGGCSKTIRGQGKRNAWWGGEPGRGGDHLTFIPAWPTRLCLGAIKN